MSKGLIERLRNEETMRYAKIMDEAADRIEQLEAERVLDEQRVADLMAQVAGIAAERDELQQHLDTTIDVLNQTRVERDELKAALKRIAVTKPAMVMNGNAKMDDPPDVKVNYNTVFIARAAIAKGEK